MHSHHSARHNVLSRNDYYHGLWCLSGLKLKLQCQCCLDRDVAEHMIVHVRDEFDLGEGR